MLVTTCQRGRIKKSLCIKNTEVFQLVDKRINKYQAKLEIGQKANKTEQNKKMRNLHAKTLPNLTVKKSKSTKFNRIKKDFKKWNNFTQKRSRKPIYKLYKTLHFCGRIVT